MSPLKFKVIKTVFFFLLMFVNISCHRETIILPNALVNYQIALVPDLNSLGSGVAMILPDKEGFFEGVGGLLVYRLDLSDFYAFDRACPYEKTANAAVTLDKSGTIATCPICGSKFLFSTDGCQVFKGPSPYPLKEYSTTIQGGNYLVITN